MVVWLLVKSTHKMVAAGAAVSFNPTHKNMINMLWMVVPYRVPLHNHHHPLPSISVQWCGDQSKDRRSIPQSDKPNLTRPPSWLLSRSGVSNGYHAA